MAAAKTTSPPGAARAPGPDLQAIVVRTQIDEIEALCNARMRRGTQLKPPGSRAASENLRCPFHARIYSLAGALLELPESWDFPHASPS